MVKLHLILFNFFQKCLLPLPSGSPLQEILFPRFSPVFQSSMIKLSVPHNLSRNPVDGFFKVRPLQLTLPDDDDAPAFRLQLPPYLLIPLLVPCDFSYPEFCVSFWDRIILTVFVTMPEAAVHKDDGAVFWKHNVRRTWKALVVEPVSITPAPQLGPHNPLRYRIPGADAGHVVGALGGGHSERNVRYWVVTLNPSVLASLTIPGIPSIDH